MEKDFILKLLHLENSTEYGILDYQKNEIKYVYEYNLFLVHLITRLKITRLISSTHRYPFERKIKSGFCQNKFNIYIIGVAHPSICRRIHKKNIKTISTKYQC